MESNREGDTVSSAVLDAAFEEYRALYGLVVFRMTALDRRVPVVGAGLGAFLASVATLPRESQIILLLGLPLALVWFLRTTVNHARSFEDALRRIEQIERHVNDLVGCETLAFQSRHPSRGRFVGGRTASETIRSVLVAAGTMLAACVYLFASLIDSTDVGFGTYAAYVLTAALSMGLVTWRLGRYRYEPEDNV